MSFISLLLTRGGEPASGPNFGVQADVMLSFSCEYLLKREQTTGRACTRPVSRPPITFTP